VAVNPETRLAALARKRGWLVEQFDKARGSAEPPLPIGPSWHGRGPTVAERLMKVFEGRSGHGPGGSSSTAGAAR
jgi:hypothetical protein